MKTAYNSLRSQTWYGHGYWRWRRTDEDRTRQGGVTACVWKRWRSSGYYQRTAIRTRNAGRKLQEV